MRILFVAPIQMDDGVVLRADVFLPEQDGTYPAEQQRDKRTRKNMEPGTNISGRSQLQSDALA